MEKHEYIPLETICHYHSVSDSFIFSLNEIDLIEISVIDERNCIPASQLTDLEKYVRLHRDLEINFEGIDVINHLVQRIQSMQHQMDLLEKRLELYEPKDR
ncbi:hypothetical protein JKA74_13005 [Marivirga sp. S37H4]|uniref:MerR family transcriptional regulator n=1 Tax=Marivirga aurantiaca TaxID=2802615 RepID=A0A934WZN2_9BACT|nr:chaperone modulator CbpM [Marivirga aurantiaca]MBK6265954.1 hypothetical protein [Marivirga aurantiaca]